MDGRLVVGADRRLVVGRGRLPLILLAVCTAAFLAVSYLPYLAPARAVNLASMTVFWSFYCSTFIILCDQAANLLEHRSLLEQVVGGWRAFGYFLAIGAICGLFLDGTAQWAGKLWIYPYWNEAVYGSTFVIGFSAYWLMLAETYFAAKAILKRFIPDGWEPRSESPRPLPAAPCAVAGWVLLALWAAVAVHDYRAAGGYRFDITTPVPIRVPFAGFMLAFFGVWMLIEWRLIAQRKPSLLQSVVAGNRMPLWTILAAGWISGFLMETANAAHHFWVYTNWPLEGVRLFGVPAVVLIAWPVQHVIFLSVYRAVWPKDSAAVFP